MKLKEWLPQELSQDIFNKKYRFKDESLEVWFDRVSGYDEQVKEIIKQKKFIFGGRILANRGLQKYGRKGTYSNCYVLPAPQDNLESIFDTAKEMAKTFSFGGGVGIDISNLSPKGAKINNAARETTGSVSFMDLYSLTTELIGQHGRRGATMISIDVSHPDILDFIEVKNDPTKVTKANISIRISDEFMMKVLTNEMFELKFERDETKEVITKKVKARELLKLISESNWKMGEPGVLFWDNITKNNLFSEDENIEYAGVNPCAEEPLPAYGSCLLGSINLSTFVENPFNFNSKFNYDEFGRVVRLSVKALNDVLHEGLPLHPLEQQKKVVNDLRQIGLGLFGFHDALIKLGIVYGEKESLELIDKIGKVYVNNALQESARLCDKFGTYPKYNKKAILRSKFLNEVATKETINLVEEKGLAHSQLLTIPPTGSIATMLGVSTALEPIYSISYLRKTESLHGEDKYYKVFTPIVSEYMEKFCLNENDKLPNYFNTSQTINYINRLKVQGRWQKYIDASISSTVNVPESFTSNQIEDLYIKAWVYGLKGVTVFRDNCYRAGILSEGENTSVISNDKSKVLEDIYSITCPECGENVIHEGGCIVCKGCGYGVCN